MNGLLSWRAGCIVSVVLLCSVACGSSNEQPGTSADAGPEASGDVGAPDAASGGDGAPEASTEAGPPPGPCAPVTSDPDIQQKLPQVYIDTTYTPPSGKTISVAAGGDLQAAIDSANPGDVVSIQAGASFTGPFKLPNKTGNAYVVIRTAAPDSALPVPGKRIDPSFAAVMPKLLAPSMLPAVQASTGAHHYRFIGVEVTPADPNATIYDLFEIGAGSETTLTDLPHDIILDRVYVHGTPTASVKRGVQLNGGATAVVDSYVSDCHAVGQDAQAIGGWAGPGPYKIVNDRLEGSGENVLFGGADPTIANVIPSDIEIRHNHIVKPLTWKADDPSYAGTHWSVKNLLELKNARRVLVQCNVLEQNWADAQVGFAFLVTPRNQSGTAPWCGVQDVTVEDNILRHSASGMNFLGEDNNFPSQQTSGIVAKNNLLYDLDATKWGGDGRLWQVTTPATQPGGSMPGRPVQGLKIAHNTGFVVGNSTLAMGDNVPVAAKLFFEDNIASHAMYGIFGSGQGEGTAALSFFAPGYACLKNVFIGGGTAAQYPVNNAFAATPADVGFVDYAGGDYHLAGTSAYKNGATDGTDIGANIDTINSGTAGVVP